MLLHHNLSIYDVYSFKSLIHAEVLYIMNNMIRLKGSHYEIGLQHGQKLASIIRNSVIPFVDVE